MSSSHHASASRIEFNTLYYVCDDQHRGLGPPGLDRACTLLLMPATPRSIIPVRSLLQSPLYVVIHNMASPAQLQELHTLGRVIYILTITLVIWSWLAVGLRLWVRFRITKSPGWDDAVMVATLVSLEMLLVHTS